MTQGASHDNAISVGRRLGRGTLFERDEEILLIFFITFNFHEYIIIIMI